MGKEKGSPGRPKVLVRRHILEIKEETRNWLEEQIQEVKGAFLAAKGIGAAGEAAEGLLSNPIAFPVVFGAILAGLGGVVSEDAISVIIEFFSSVQGVFSAPAETREQREAADRLILAQKGILDVFSGGIFSFLFPEV